MGRVFLPQQDNNLAGEQMAIANQTATNQMAKSINGGSQLAGTLMDGSAHMAALPAFVTIILLGGLLFWLVFHSHLSLAASVGVGHRE